MVKILRIFGLFIIFCGCSAKKDLKEENTLFTSAKGNKFYGGTLKLNESDYIKNLFPHNITDAISYRVATQVYEGLLKFNQNDLSLLNAIAKSYTTNEAKTVYTFKLNEGVYFHDDPCFKNGKGRELTTEDIKYCFTLLCKQDINNQ